MTIIWQHKMSFALSRVHLLVQNAVAHARRVLILLLKAITISCNHFSERRLSVRNDVEMYG